MKHQNNESLYKPNLPHIVSIYKERLNIKCTVHDANFNRSNQLFVYWESKYNRYTVFFPTCFEPPGVPKNVGKENVYWVVFTFSVPEILVREAENQRQLHVSSLWIMVWGVEEFDHWAQSNKVWSGLEFLHVANAGLSGKSYQFIKPRIITGLYKW